MLVSSYQMKSSCAVRLQRLRPCALAYHATLSLWLVSQRPPTDHCAMPRPGPPPYCAIVGLTPDSCTRLPMMPADCTLVSPLATKKLNAVCSFEESASSDKPVSSPPSTEPAQPGASNTDITRRVIVFLRMPSRIANDMPAVAASYLSKSALADRE